MILMPLLLAVMTLTNQVTWAQQQEESEGLFNKLLAPGPLMKGHKDLEKADCLKCHDVGKGVPNQKCLSCHVEIKDSMKDDIGFHAYHRQETCISCHSDHKGSDYDSTKVDEKAFDHSKTGFVLDGKHKTLKCAECHTEKRSKKPIRSNEIKYLGQTTSCKSCHIKDDVHFFKGKYKEKDCNSCHGTKKWTEQLKFDHQKDTQFALEGKHAKVECKTCHVPKGPNSAKYDWPSLKSKKCLSCHQDQHAGAFSPKFSGGGACISCHNQTQWKIPSFQHAEVTGFALKGAHQSLKCEECHKQTPAKKSAELKDFKFTGLQKTCVSCHKDFHGFSKTPPSRRFGSLLTCDTCHSETTWKQQIDFNHNLDTRFTIDGKHTKNTCVDCHKALNPKQNKKSYVPRKYHWLHLEQKTCENCHQSPHTKTFSKELLAKKCTACHITDDWHKFRSTGKGKEGFHHDATRFPLTGKHAKTSCDSCHVVKGKQKFKFENAERKFCVSCHENVHDRQFSKKFSDKSCAECHNTEKFAKLLDFDHRKTDFQLDGAHNKFAKDCQKCHIKTNQTLNTDPPVKAGKYQFANGNNGFCQSCHENIHTDQFSKGFYSKPCTACHSTLAFSKRKTFNHDLTAFKLTGAHTKVKCFDCHKPTNKILTKTPKKYKHKFLFADLETKNCVTCHKDPHKGEHGTSCTDCHNEVNWGRTRDFHKFFALSGIHYMLRCNECHTDARRLGGLSEQCVFCHQDDDYHGGALPECGTCHTQEFWELTHFKHSMTNFPLRGIHRVLECEACHAGGIYEGTPSECVTCHLQDAQPVTFPNHAAPGFDQCGDCHNQFSFESAR